MTATPAQVANDMAAQAKYWSGRDMEIETACILAAKVIRDFLSEAPPAHYNVRGALDRLQILIGKPRYFAGNEMIFNSIIRAEATIRALRDGGAKPQ